MRSAADPVLSRATGAGPAAIVLIICVGLLAACSGTTLPFSKASDVQSWRPPPPVVVGAIAGLPADQESALVDALVSAGVQRDIAVGRVEVENGHALTGAFEAATGRAGTAIRYRWTLTDPTGRVLHRIEESETAPLPVGEAWAGVDGDVVRRIAAYTAESLSSRFSQLGYATRAAGLPPPLDHMVQAGPDAENEIDYETLYGPNRTAMSDPSAGSQAPLPEHVAAGSQPPSDSGSHSQAASSGPAIRGVAITGVHGAGHTGNGELLNALKSVLTDAGWPVEEGGPRDDVLAIRGDVSVGPASGKAQKVALRWTVTAPDGRILGAVEQANDVPAGSLDGGWGPAAHYAALAAAEGIFDLVDKLR
jgi:hypothetical protein